MRHSIASRRPARDWAFVGLCVVGMIWIGARSLNQAETAPFISPQVLAGPNSEEPLFEERFASRNLQDFVHSPTVVALENGDLIAAWFAGSREGAKDVVIRSVRFDGATGKWGPEQVLITRQETEKAVGRYIRKLGNPAIAQGPDGRIWLFYVSVSVGGWSKSSVNFITSADQGKTWTAPKRLITSPFLNVSTLVRSPPVFHENGVIGLPVYHELFGKFPEYLYLDSNGVLRDKVRMGLGGRDALQPAVVPLGGQQAVALLRYSGDPPNHVLGTTTSNAGMRWSAPIRLAPENPNSSMAATHSGLADWPVLVAQNDLADERFRLTLHVASTDLQTWKMVRRLDSSPSDNGEPTPIEQFRKMIRDQYLNAGDAEQDTQVEQALARIEQQMCRNGKSCDFDFEYPTFSVGRDGRFHLVYAWNDTLIKHVSFNRAWLAQQLAKK